MPLGDHGAFRSVDDAREASAESIREYMRLEVKRICSEVYVKQEAFAKAIDVTRPTVNRWISGDLPVSKPGAAKLDRRGLKPGIDLSFSELRALFDDRTRSGTPAKRTRFDVFLASPMASARGSDAYEREQRSAVDVKRAIETAEGFKVYYAGANIPTVADFQTAELAAEANFAAIADTRFFVLMVLGDLNKQSSVYVEAGYALALKLPSLYLVKDVGKLPYVLRTFNALKPNPALPPVKIETVESAHDAAALLRTNGGEIFRRLEAAALDRAR